MVPKITRRQRALFISGPELELSCSHLPTLPQRGRKPGAQSWEPSADHQVCLCLFPVSQDLLTLFHCPQCSGPFIVGLECACVHACVRCHTVGIYFTKWFPSPFPWQHKPSEVEGNVKSLPDKPGAAAWWAVPTAGGPDSGFYYRDLSALPQVMASESCFSPEKALN